MPGAEASFSEIKVSCNYAISPLSSFAGESLPQADLPCVFRRQLWELGKYTPYGLIVSIPTTILADPFQSFDEFLLMFSVFSEKAPREMKVHYAFKIYGKSVCQTKGLERGLVA